MALRWRFLVGVIALFAASCGGGARTPGADTTSAAGTGAPAAAVATAAPAAADFSIDACKLLTLADVSAIAPPTGPVQSVKDPTSSTCVYPYGRVGGISLFAGTAVYGQVMPAAYDQVKAQYQPQSPTDVAGVGDAAFYVPALAELWFKRGGTLFEIKALGVPSWSVDVAKGLALKALGRL